ncbi:hypothetical protein BDV29DRAFT_108624 [Aspergillus leporis]|uniref:Uncharacterized protein n=1 Tax=Aspergillus leporis TaxID=41062 RepID=A0A5N5X790_9EURO|nr:hypothetical protein BDV29DRAFT_108624 [Aspergillus leporis]
MILLVHFLMHGFAYYPNTNVKDSYNYLKLRSTFVSNTNKDPFIIALSSSFIVIHQGLFCSLFYLLLFLFLMFPV